MKTRLISNEQKYLLVIFTLITLGIIVYYNSLDGQFLWDDLFLIKSNPYIKNWSHLPNILTGSINQTADYKSFFYRPAQLLTYLIEYSVWGLNEYGYHLTNILLHISVAICLFWLINIIFKKFILAILVSLFFICHPIHTEAVSYISGRADLLAALFLLLGSICYLNYYRNKKQSYLIIAAICYLAALSSKEYCLIFPGILLLLHFASKIKLRLKPLLPILLITTIYIIVRATLLKSVNMFYVDTSPWQRLPGFFLAITNYIRLLICPYNQHMEYGMQFFNWNNPQTIMGIILTCFLLSLAIYKRHTNRIFAFSIFWFFMTLLPVGNIYPINAYMAEHWLYLPSLGFFLLLGLLFERIYQYRKYRLATITGIVFIITAYSLLTIKQNVYWLNPFSFYKKTLQYAPNSQRIYNNLAVLYKDKGNPKEAIKLLNIALQFSPQEVDFHNNLAMAHYDDGNIEKAIAILEKCLALDPQNPNTYTNLGPMYIDADEYEKGIAALYKASDLDPNNANVYYNLGIAYSKNEDNKTALQFLEKAIQLDPFLITAYNQIGKIYMATGNISKAKEAFIQIIYIDPNNFSAYNNLAIVARDLGLENEAIALLEKAIAINPDYIKGYRNLAKIYESTRQNKLAATCHLKIAELTSGDTSTIDR